MRNTVIAVFFVIKLLIIPGFSNCDENNGGQAVAFLRIPVGARPAGMGNTFTAIADDANVMYFNPGGLYQVDGYNFGGMYSIMSFDRSHYQGSFVFSHKTFGSFGLMFVGFGVSEIDGRDRFGLHTKKFDDSENALSVGYGRKVLPFLGIGGNLKYITHSLMDSKATGIGFDIGAHSRIDIQKPHFKAIRFGISFANIGTSIEWDTESSHKDKVPSTVRFGTGLDFEFDKVKGLIAFDGVHTSSEGFVPRAGSEIWLLETLGMRLGFDDKDVTFGFSIKYQKFQFDYAFCPDFLEEGATSKCGIQVDF